MSSGVRQQLWDTFSRLHEAAAENTRDGTSGCCDERGRFLSEVLLPSFFGLDGVQDGLPLGLVTLPDLLDLLLHLRVQRGQTQTQLLHRPRAHLHTHIIFIQLWVLEILKKKQLTCYQAELSWAEVLERLNFKTRTEKHPDTHSSQYDRQLLTISWTCVTYLTDLCTVEKKCLIGSCLKRNKQTICWPGLTHTANLLLSWLQLEADNHTTDIKD